MTEREAAAASERDAMESLARQMELWEPGVGSVHLTADELFAFGAGCAALSRAVRMLTDDEVWAVWDAKSSRSGPITHARECIRKFCEVNGIVPLAPQDTGGK
jgi:hypothetical protein